MVSRKVKLSIVIVNYNTKYFLIECLNSIYRTVKKIPFEILVIDNASFDGSEEIIPQIFPEINFIPNSENLGYSRANNQALKKAKGEFILLLNPDTVLTDKAIETMISFMEKNPLVGVIGPYLINGQRKTQLSYNLSSFLFPATDQIIDYLYDRLAMVKKAIYLLSKKRKRKAKKVALVMGACMLIKREVIKSVGLLDERFFLYGEDADYCYRVIKKGFHIFFLPYVYVIHYGGASSRFLRYKRFIEARSYVYYFWKNLFQPNFLTIKRQTKYLIEQLNY